MSEQELKPYFHEELEHVAAGLALVAHSDYSAGKKVNDTLKVINSKGGLMGCTCTLKPDQAADCLKSQLDAVTAERDELRSGLDSFKRGFVESTAKLDLLQNKLNLAMEFLGNTALISIFTTTNHARVLCDVVAEAEMTIAKIAQLERKGD